MVSLINSYLTSYYEIKTSDAGNDGIYSLEDTRRFKAPVESDKLLSDLESVFGVSNAEAKVYLNDWAITNKPDIDLTFYWKPLIDFTKFIRNIVK